MPSVMSVLRLRGPRSRQLGLLILVLVAAVLIAPTRAFAHAALVSSTPANGSSGPAPSTIKLTYNKTFAVVSPGIQLLDGAGKPVPTQLAVAETTATLTPKAPLGPGSYGVKWTVKAPDSHPRSGAFTFTVKAAPVPTTSPPAAAAAPAAAASTTSSTQPDLATTTSVPVPEVAGERLSAALAAPSTTAYDLLGAIGRIVLYLGLTAVIGALALGFFVARASAREAQWTVLLARRASLAIALGALIWLIADVGLLAGPGIPWPWKFSAWGSAIWSSFGLTILCALVGTGILVRSRGPRFAKTDTWMRTPVGVGAATAQPAPEDHPYVAGRLDPRTAGPILTGVGLVLVGLALNGHSQGSSPLIIGWVANIAHVLAAGVWGGGLLILLALIARRTKAKDPALTLDAVLRFSTVATIASIAAGVSGVILAAVELPSVGALVTSAFGRILIVKVLVVAAIAAAGAYHHFVLLPQLEADPSAAQSTATWKLLRYEAVGVAVVLVLTAFLVSASYT